MTVSEDDRGLLYGDGVFDTMLAVDGRFPDLGRHLDRLETGALALGIAFDRAEVERKARAAAAGRVGEAAVRVTLTRGPGAGLSPQAAGPPTVVARAGPVPWSARDRDAGVPVVVASLRRIPSACLDPRLKTLNYLPNVLARQEAERRGAREAVFLDLHGDVVEAAAANLFAVRAGALLTPPLSSGCFPGFAREDVLALARTHDVPCEERRLRPEDVAGADEGFLTSSLAGVVPFTMFEGAVLDGGRTGPLTRRVQTLYGDLVRRRLPPVKGP